MRLIDIVNGPWATTPAMLTEIQSIYTRHCRGEKIDLSALEARIGAPLANEPKGYTIEDGVAVLPIDGVIAKKMNLFSRISGGTSSDLIGRDLQAAFADRAVEAIVLAVDSPGGTVDGTPELAAQIYAARGVKPILAHTDGMMASAAYWIGAAADQVFISSDVTMVGSIGVVSAHTDVSKAEDKQGIKTTEIYAGKYKRIASQYGPLTEEGRADIQDMVDHVYGVFVEDVARFRETSVEDVLARMADGRLFHGKKAIDAGLVDGVSTLAAVIDKARALARSKTKTSRAGVAQALIDPMFPERSRRAQGQPETTQSTTGVKIMNLQELKAEHPELVQAITKEAQSGMAEAVNAAKIDGAAAETARVAAVRAQSIPGHEKLVEAMIADGNTTGAEAAMAIVAAENNLRSAALKAIESEAPPAAPAAEATDDAKGLTRSAFAALSALDRAAFIKSGGIVRD
jgi:signal peptide peptidase SppA